MHISCWLGQAGWYGGLRSGQAHHGQALIKLLNFIPVTVQVHSSLYQKVCLFDSGTLMSPHLLFLHTPSSLHPCSGTCSYANTQNISNSQWVSWSLVQISEVLLNMVRFDLPSSFPVKVLNPCVFQEEKKIHLFLIHLCLTPQDITRQELWGVHVTFPLLKLLLLFFFKVSRCTVSQLNRYKC